MRQRVLNNVTCQKLDCMNLVDYNHNFYLLDSSLWKLKSKHMKKWVLICLITQMYRMIFTIYNVLKEKKQLYKQSEWFIWGKRMQVQECIIGRLCWLILDVNIKCELKSLFLILEKIATHTNVSMERKSLFFRSLFLCWVLF